MSNDVLLMLGVVFALNLLPAFAPPTWIVLVYFGLKRDVPNPVLIVGGALAASAGRFVLANLFRRFGGHLPPAKRRDLEAVGAKLNERKRGRWGIIALFLLSPLPSAQMFAAAGLSPQVRLVPLTAAFFAGRLVTYTIYVTGASAAEGSLSKVFDGGLTSASAIALQVGMLALLAAFVFTPWAKILDRHEAAKA